MAENNPIKISTRPYLIDAFYNWIVDNQWTPHMVVNADIPGVEVPKQYIENGRIILNVSPSAVHGLKLGKAWIEFSARFSNMSIAIKIPSCAVIAIYARENGRGMVFGDDMPAQQDKDSHGGQSSNNKTARSKPQLKVVK